MSTHDLSNAPRNGQGRLVRQPANVDRDARAALLASQGHSYADIAAELGYSSKGDAWRGARKALQELASVRSLAQMRSEQITENTELRRIMWRTVNDPPQAYDRLGRPCEDSEGNPIPDEAIRQGAAQVIKGLEERLARLTGMDAPKRPLLDQVTDEQLLEHMQQRALINGASPLEVYGASAIPGYAEP